MQQYTVICNDKIGAVIIAESAEQAIRAHGAGDIAIEGAFPATEFYWKDGAPAPLEAMPLALSATDVLAGEEVVLTGVPAGAEIIATGVPHHVRGDGAVLFDTAGYSGKVYLRIIASGYTMAALNFNVVEFSRLKTAKKEAISGACRSEIVSGFDSSALGERHHYPAKETDQLNLSGSILDSLLPDLPTDWTTPFWCADTSGLWAFRLHTASQIQQVGHDAKAAILAAMGKNEVLQAQIAAAGSVEELEAIAFGQ